MSIRDTIAKNRASGFRHHSYEMERRVIAAILKGDAGKALEYAQQGENIAYKDILAPQPLRAQKNMAISLVAVVSRAIIEHGADAESVFFLSDYFLNEIEQAGSNKDIEKILVEMVREYCRAAKEARTDHHSAVIKKCLQMINNHIYEKCTVEKLARSLHLSPDYLSALFRKEMGAGLYSHILNVKIEEAKDRKSVV
jgi:YesN/AraC family two-component response regulator